MCIMNGGGCVENSGGGGTVSLCSLKGKGCAVKYLGLIRTFVLVSPFKIPSFLLLISAMKTSSSSQWMKIRTKMSHKYSNDFKQMFHFEIRP